MPKSPDKPLDMKDKRIQTALKLVFEGRLSLDKIAKRCEVSPRTLWAWTQHSDFIAALEAMRKDFAASIQHVTFADKAKRIIALDHAAGIALNELEERPLLKEVRPTRDGEITNEAFNNAAMSEFRSALDDIAKELGQRTSKVDVTTAGEKLSSNVSEAIAAVVSDPEATEHAYALLDRLAATRPRHDAGGVRPPGE